jgi:hypothetical protein
MVEIKCLVLCRDGSGKRVLFPSVLSNITQGMVKSKLHHAMAADSAMAEGCTQVEAVYDEYGGPADLFERVDWTTLEPVGF